MRQGRPAPEHHQGDVPLAHQIAPAGLQALDRGVLTQEILTEEVRAPVDEDLLLRPGIVDIASPLELCEQAPLELRASCLPHRGDRKDRGVESIVDELCRACSTMTER